MEWVEAPNASPEPKEAITSGLGGTRTAGPPQRGRFDSKRCRLLALHLCLVRARISRNKDEAHLPAQQPQEEEDPRIPGPHEDQGRTAGAQEAPSEGPPPRRGLAPPIVEAAEDQRDRK